MPRPRPISVAGGGKVKLKETKTDSMGIFGGIRTELSGTSLEKLTLFSGEEAEDTLLRLSQDTEVPEIQVDGGKEVTIEGKCFTGRDSGNESTGKTYGTGNCFRKK